MVKIYLFFICMMIGFLGYLSKKEVDIIENKIPKSIDEEKNKYLRNIFGNLYLFYCSYRSKDTYLCRFYRKTGTVLVIFVNNIEEAKEYMDWYLDKDSNSYKKIIINSNRATIIQTNDIEEFEYQKILWIRGNVINPILAFLQQPISSFLSVRKIMFIYLLSIGSLATFYHLSSGLSYERFNEVINISTSILSAILILWGLTIITLGLLSFNNARKTYYTNKYINKKTILKQLLVLFSVPILFNALIQPYITDFIKLAQNYMIK